MSGSAYGETSDATADDEDALVRVLVAVAVDTFANNKFVALVGEVDVGSRGGGGGGGGRHSD